MASPEKSIRPQLNAPLSDLLPQECERCRLGTSTPARSHLPKDCGRCRPDDGPRAQPARRPEQRSAQAVPEWLRLPRRGSGMDSGTRWRLRRRRPGVSARLSLSRGPPGARRAYPHSAQIQAAHLAHGAGGGAVIPSSARIVPFAAIPSMAALADRRTRPGLRPAMDPAATHQGSAPIRKDGQDKSLQTIEVLGQRPDVGGRGHGCGRGSVARRGASSSGQPRQKSG